MLTDELAAEAERAYAELPGTPPDSINTRKMVDNPDGNRELLREMFEESKADGMGWVRYTVDEGHGYLWCEAWKYRPYKEAPFTPHYTYTPVTVNGDRSA